jgi:hypothetical protein
VWKSDLDFRETSEDLHNDIIANLKTLGMKLELRVQLASSEVEVGERHLGKVRETLAAISPSVDGEEISQASAEAIDPVSALNYIASKFFDCSDSRKQLSKELYFAASMNYFVAEWRPVH